MPKKSEQYYSSLVGKKFGKLTIISIIRKFGSKTLAVCSCDCGGTSTTPIAFLNYGHTKSCSPVCGMTKHGQTKTPTYQVWRAMVYRCTKPNNPVYNDYGGRGIVVCNEWIGKNGFINFVNDMGVRPSSKHSIDRVDNDGGYSKENCRWATNDIQQYNRRDTLRILFDGQVMTTKEVADRLGITPQNVRNRVKQFTWV